MKIKQKIIKRRQQKRRNYFKFVERDLRVIFKFKRIRNSLYNNGQYSFYERIASATKDPSQIRVEFVVSGWGECEHLNCLEGIQVCVVI